MIKGKTPVVLAAEKKHCETVKVMMETGCDIQSKDDHGNETIHWAAVNGHINMVKLLLEFNADKNARGEEDKTPLIIAARKNRGILVKMLIEAECDANSKVAHGNLAYHYAVDCGSKESVDVLGKSRTIDNLLDSVRSNEDSWNFEIHNEEMYLTNDTMSSIMELYIPKGALPLDSSSLVKATISHKCTNNPGTQDQEGQIGPTISLLPHGTKFARPILALIRLPYDDFFNAEEFEFIVIHSDNEVDAPEEWMNATDDEKGETSGLVIPEHNVSMVVLFHFSFLRWFRRRRTKLLEMLVLTLLVGKTLTVTCRFCSADSMEDKGVYADCKGTVISSTHLVITSQDSPIEVSIAQPDKAWKILSPQNQQMSHDLVWNPTSSATLHFVFEMGDNPSRYVCTIVAQHKRAKSVEEVILPIELLSYCPEKASEASNSTLGHKMVESNLDSLSEQAASDSSRFAYDEATAAASESKTELSLPREFRSNYTVEENSRIQAQLNRPIPESILKIVNENREELKNHITMGATLLNHLRQKRVFTTQQMEAIKIEDGRNTKQTIMVLDMLPTISFHRYILFRDSLTATNQEHVCAYLPTCDASDVLRTSRIMDDRLDSDRSNEESWSFEIPNEEMYLTNGNMSSMMELYIPKGALPFGSSSVVKATIRQTCNQNSETQDQEVQIGPTISLHPHGTKFARPILALIRLPYDELLNAEEFEFIVLHSDTEVEDQVELVDITEFNERETCGIVVPEHNVSLILLFHFSILDWLRRRLRKILQVLVLAKLEGEMLKVTCRFCPDKYHYDKDVKANFRKIASLRWVITSDDSPIGVDIARKDPAWELRSPDHHKIDHYLVWRTDRFPEVHFLFKMVRPLSPHVCNIKVNHKSVPATLSVTWTSDLLADRSSQSAEARGNTRSLELEVDRPSQSAEARSYQRGPQMEAGTEWTSEQILPEEFKQKYFSEDEISFLNSKVKGPIPDEIRSSVSSKCDKLAELIHISQELLNHLESKSVFTKEQLQNIKAPKGLMQEQASLMIDMLQKASFHRYVLFRGCLRATGQEHVCDCFLPFCDVSSNT